MLDKESLIERVQSFANYPPNWDGMGAELPTPTAITDAERVIKLLPDNIARPHVSLAADGEINFKWMMPAVNMGLSIYGDGKCFYYGEGADSESVFTFAHSASCDRPLPDSILRRLMVTEGSN